MGKEKIEIIFTSQDEKEFWAEKYSKKCEARIISLKYLPDNEKALLFNSIIDEIKKMNYLVIYEKKIIEQK